MPSEQSPEPGPRSPARLVRVDASHEGRRIDNFLAGCLKDVPRSRIYRILRRGEVRVNGGRTRQDYRLRDGDLVRIPPLRLAEQAAVGPPSDRALELIGRAVLYEDDGLVIINKPAGIAVHGGSGLRYGVIEALRALAPRRPFLELVHRLDRDTSGCLLVAKKRSVLRALHHALREREVDKHYLALVRGYWRGGARTVELPLRRDVLRAGERVVRAHPEGRSASTSFHPLSPGKLATLVEARIATGRTHQIRVHAAAAGHPLGGDEKYGDRPFNARLRAFGLRRLFLHASRVAFVHPATGSRLDLSAPLPDDLLAVLRTLDLSTEPHAATAAGV